MNVLSGWFERILGRSSSPRGGTQQATAEVREGEESGASTADQLEEGAHTARDQLSAREAPRPPTG